MEDRRAEGGLAGDRQRAAGDKHEHDRGARRGDRRPELRLAAGHAQVEPIARLARLAVVGDAGALAHDDDRHVLGPRCAS